MIDRIVLKVNPFVMGTGIPLFGGGRRVVLMETADIGAYANGVLLVTYRPTVVRATETCT